MNIDRPQSVTFPDLKSIPAQDPFEIEKLADAFQAQRLGSDDKGELLQLAVRMVDLTTLEGSDTPERVRKMCKKAEMPNGIDFSIPHVAAVCVYPTLVGVAAKALENSQVQIASVAGAFPSGQARIAQKVSEVNDALSEGADEIDIVISRGKLLDGEYHEVFDEICQCREACRESHLKVILETGELETYDNIRWASELAIAAGADFIKTSTGKITPAATFPATLVMLHAISDYHQRTGRMVGIKPAGGIRTSDQALGYLKMVESILGVEWMTPQWCRFGASSLLDELVTALSNVPED